MQGRDQGNVPEEVSFINTQLSGRYVLCGLYLKCNKNLLNRLIESIRIFAMIF